MDAFEALLRAVDRGTPGLLALSEEASARVPAPGKWSAKEILGHLIDSASVNHRRFVRARAEEDLVFEGYDQDAWVESGRYREAPWPELVSLWRGYNLQVARVMASVPAEVRSRERRRHNLEEIAFVPVPADRPATLDYLMRDYVDHLEHHLAQIAARRTGPRD